MWRKNAHVILLQTSNTMCGLLCGRYREFESLIQQWRVRPGEFQDDFPWKISDADLVEHKQKVGHWEPDRREI